MTKLLLSLTACSTLGATGLIARLAMASNTTRVYPTALLGRLVTRHRPSQDLVRTSGSLSLLIDHIKASTSMPVLSTQAVSQSNTIHLHHHPCRGSHQTRLQRQGQKPLLGSFRAMVQTKQRCIHLVCIINALPQRHVAGLSCLALMLHHVLLCNLIPLRRSLSSHQEIVDRCL